MKRDISFDEKMIREEPPRITEQSFKNVILLLLAAPE